MIPTNENIENYCSRIKDGFNTILKAYPCLAKYEFTPLPLVYDLVPFFVRFAYRVDNNATGRHVIVTVGGRSETPGSIMYMSHVSYRLPDCMSYNPECVTSTAKLADDDRFLHYYLERGSEPIPHPMRKSVAEEHNAEYAPLEEKDKRSAVAGHAYVYCGIYERVMELRRKGFLSGSVNGETNFVTDLCWNTINDLICKNIMSAIKREKNFSAAITERGIITVGEALRMRIWELLGDEYLGRALAHVQNQLDADKEGAHDRFVVSFIGKNVRALARKYLRGFAYVGEEGDDTLVDDNAGISNMECIQAWHYKRLDDLNREICALVGYWTIPNSTPVGGPALTEAMARFNCGGFDVFIDLHLPTLAGLLNIIVNEISWYIFETPFYCDDADSDERDWKRKALRSEIYENLRKLVAYPPARYKEMFLAHAARTAIGRTSKVDMYDAAKAVWHLARVAALQAVNSKRKEMKE